MDAYRTPDERFADLPGYGFDPHYAEVGGLRLHYVDEGSGPPIVCFHGEPTWAYLYRKMAPPLVGGGFVGANDLKLRPEAHRQPERVRDHAAASLERQKERWLPTRLPGAPRRKSTSRVPPARRA